MALDPHANPGATTADEAIALVLRHEQAARATIDTTRAQALQLAETARADARATAARAERRLRAVMTAFERETETRTAALDAQAEAMAQAHVLTAQDHEQLARAVQSLADELARGAP